MGRCLCDIAFPRGALAMSRNISSPWLRLASLVDLSFLYLPIAVLALFSFNASRLAATWEGATLKWYRLLLADPSMLAALQNSLIVAVTSTMLATVLGLGLALSLHRGVFRHAGLLQAAVVLPLVIPEVTMGVALLLFFVLIKLPL